MKILISVSNYPPLAGGLGVYSQNLGKALVKQGHEVRVLTLEGDSLKEEQVEGLSVIKIPRRLGYRDVFATPLGQASLARIRSEIGVSDVVNAHTRYFPLTQISVALGRQAGVPVVLTEHGGGFVKSTSALTTIGARLVDLTLGRKALQSASQVLAVSHRGQDFIKELSGVNATIVGNGIDLEFWNRSKALGSSFRSSHEKGKLNVVFVGRLVAEKGWRPLLDAWSMLSSSVRENFRLVFVGDGPDFKKLRRLIVQSGFDDVVAMGHQPRQVVRDLLCRGILVNPSWASEGFQTTLLEARALGVYVVSTAVGGASETITDPGLGHVLDSTNPRDLASAIVQALPQAGFDVGRGAADQYEWSQVADRHLDAYSTHVRCGA